MNRTRRIPRWAWWAGGVLGVLLALVVVGEAVGWPILRQPLQHAAARAAAVPVVLEGRFRTRFLWRPHVSAEHLNVGAGGGVAVPHLVDARDVELAWRWGDLWRWRQGAPLRVQTLQARTLDAQLVRTADGRASWQLGAREPRPPAPDSDPLAGLPRFGWLSVAQGNVVLDDKPLDTQLRVELRGGEGDTMAREKAGYQASVVGRYRALPLNLQLRAGGSMPLVQDTEAEGANTMVPLRVEGEAGASRVLFDGQAGALLGERRLNGALQWRGPSLAQAAEPFGITLPRTPPFELIGHLEHAGTVWRLRADRAAIGRSLLNGDFAFETGVRPSKLTGRLAGPRLALADLGPAVGAPGRSSGAATAVRNVAPNTTATNPAEGAATRSTKPTPSTQPTVSAKPAKEPPKATPTPAGAPPARPAAATTSARVLPQRQFDLPSLRAMDADVQVAVDELDLGTPAMEALRKLVVRVRLDGGVLRLDNLRASVAGGQFAGATSLDANADPARWGLDLRFSQVDIAGWLSGVRTAEGRAEAPRQNQARALKKQRQEARQGAGQPAKAYVTGVLEGQVKATGQGRSTAEILGSLNGQAQVSLRDGTLSQLATEALGLDIAEALGVLVTGDEPLPLRCARFDLALQQGVVRPRLAVIDNEDSTVRVSGQVDLRNEALALELTTKPKDVSPLALRSPVHVTGTLSDPTVSLDVKRLTAKAVGAAVLGAVVAPLAAVLPFVDRGSDDKADPCQETPAAAAPGASGAEAKAAAPPARRPPPKHEASAADAQRRPAPPGTTDREPAPRQR